MTNTPRLRALVAQWAKADAKTQYIRREALDAFRPWQGLVRVRELARRSGVSGNTISGLLRGELVVSAATALRIAQHLPDCLNEGGRADG